MDDLLYLFATQEECDDKDDVVLQVEMMKDMGAFCFLDR